jgi:hypothetical protein
VREAGKAWQGGTFDTFHLNCITSTHRSKGWNVLRTFVRGHIVGASSVHVVESKDTRNKRQCIRFCTIWEKRWPSEQRFGHRDTHFTQFSTTEWWLNGWAFSLSQIFNLGIFTFSRKNKTVVLDFRERAPISLPVQRSVPKNTLRIWILGS